MGKSSSNPAPGRAVPRYAGRPLLTVGDPRDDEQDIDREPRDCQFDSRYEGGETNGELGTTPDARRSRKGPPGERLAKPPLP